MPFIAAAVQTFLVLQVLALSQWRCGGRRRRVPHAKQRTAWPRRPLSDRMGMPAHTMRRGVDRRAGGDALRSFLVGTVVGLLSISMVVPSLDPLSTSRRIP